MCSLVFLALTGVMRVCLLACPKSSLLGQMTEGSKLSDPAMCTGDEADKSLQLQLVQRKCARHAEDPSIGPVSAIGRRYSWGGLTPANLHQLTTFHIGCSHTKMMTAFRVTERHDRLILLSAKHMGVLNMVGCTSRHFSLMPGTTPSPIDMSCAFYFQMTCSLNPLNK